MEQPQTAHKLSNKPRTIDVLSNDNIDFAGLLLSEPVLRGLKTAGFERPSPIQLKTIPLGRCGLDLIVQAKSGTGKTCVFSVVALESITCETNALQVLVLAPTREIAVQIWEVIKSIGCAVPGLRCYTFIGGLPVHDDIPKLRKCHIAVGTPGRVKQLIEQGFMDTDSIRLFVLDEADKLLEDSFQECINWIYSSLPDTKQMLALSATYPEALAQHVTAYMYNPTFVRLNTSDPALLGIRQYYKALPFHPMPQKVFDSKVKCLIKLLSSISFNQCLVFSNFQMRAESLSEKLNTKGWPSTFISGSQDQHHRLTAMAKLKKFHCRVLISTDLTSRGIDAENVNLVINIDLPKDHETYLHRIGRAGRFGSYGAAITLVCEGKEIEQLNNMESKCNTTICSLPEPIPEDLASSSGFINLDKYITTERIITKEDDSSSTRPSLRGMSHLIQNYQNKKTQVQIDSRSVQAASKTTSECKTTAFEQPNVQDLSKSGTLSESHSKESIQNEANVPIHNDNERHDGKSNPIDSLPSGNSIQLNESTQPNTSNVKLDRKEKVMPKKTVHIRKNNPRAFSFQDLLGSYEVIDKPPKKEVNPTEAVIPQEKSDTTNTTDSNSLRKSKIVSSTSALVKHSPSTRKIISFSAIQKDYESVPTDDDKDKPCTIYKEEYSPSGISFSKEDQSDIILKIKNSLLEQADRQTEPSRGRDAEEPAKSRICEVDAEASVDNIQVHDDKVPDQRPANNPCRDHHVTDGGLCQSNVTDACSELSEEGVAVISCHDDDIQATGHPIEKQSTGGESVSLQAYAAEVKNRMPADLTLGKEYVQLLGVQSSGEECDSSESTSSSSSESDVSDSSDEEYVFYDAQDDNRKFRYPSNEHYSQFNQATASTRFPSNRFFPMSYHTDHSRKQLQRQHRHGHSYQAPNTPFYDPYMYSHWLNSVSSAVYSTQCYHAYMMHMMFTQQYQTLHQNIRSQHHLATTLAQHKKLVKSWMKKMHPHN